MKGYKAAYYFRNKYLSANATNCEYKIGEIHETTGELKFCKNGFHFSRFPENVLRYYCYDSEFVLFEVEAQGKILHSYDKSVTDKLLIKRLISSKEELIDLLGFHIEFDSNNFLKKINFKNYTYTLKVLRDFAPVMFSYFLNDIGYFFDKSCLEEEFEIFVNDKKLFKKELRNV